MSTPALIDALITARKLDKLREALDAHPHLLRAWKSASWMTRAAHTGRIDLLEELHRRGLGVDDTGSDGLPPLWAAVAHPEVVAWLLDRGADARHPAVLVSAASRGDLDTVRRLVAAGGDRHATFGDPPRTAYEQAVRMGRRRRSSTRSARRGPASTWPPGSRRASARGWPTTVRSASGARGSTSRSTPSRERWSA